MLRTDELAALQTIMAATVALNRAMDDARKVGLFSTVEVVETEPTTPRRSPLAAPAQYRIVVECSLHIWLPNLESQSGKLTFRSNTWVG